MTPGTGPLRDAAREAYERHMRGCNDLILKYNFSNPFAFRAPVPMMVRTRLREFDARYGGACPMNLPTLERTGGLLVILFGSRVLARWRTSRRERVELTTPLFDAVLLEAVFAPRPQDGDDANLLEEMRDTFRHLNRRAYAEEFWSLHQPARRPVRDNGGAAAGDHAPRPPAPAARQRPLAASCRRQDLRRTEAARGRPPLRALLELGDSQRYTPSKAEYTTADAADVRYRQELEQSLVTLTTP